MTSTLTMMPSTAGSCGDPTATSALCNLRAEWRLQGSVDIAPITGLRFVIEEIR